MVERILVTGGGGFIGTNLVQRLLVSGWSVRVVDSFVSGAVDRLSQLDVELIREDIRRPGVLAEATSDVAAVVHLAAHGSVVDSVADPLDNFSANVAGTVTLLDAARTNGVGRVVFASTGGALIGNAPLPVDERSLPRPISPYGAGKLACEAYCHAFAASLGLSTVALRFANVYGPFSGHKKGAVTAFLKALAGAEPLVIHGDGKASRDFMHVADICSGIECALAAEVPGGSVFHLATGVETSVLELACACRLAAGRPDHPIEFRPPRRGEVERNFASYDLAREVLHFKPEILLDEGLRATWDWFLSEAA